MFKTFGITVFRWDEAERRGINVQPGYSWVVETPTINVTNDDDGNTILKPATRILQGNTLRGGYSQSYTSFQDAAAHLSGALNDASTRVTMLEEIVVPMDNGSISTESRVSSVELASFAVSRQYQPEYSASCYIENNGSAKCQTASGKCYIETPTLWLSAGGLTYLMNQYRTTLITGEMWEAARKVSGSSAVSQGELREFTLSGNVLAPVTDVDTAPSFSSAVIAIPLRYVGSLVRGVPYSSDTPTETATQDKTPDSGCQTEPAEQKDVEDFFTQLDATLVVTTVDTKPAIDVETLAGKARNLRAANIHAVVNGLDHFAYLQPWQAPTAKVAVKVAQLTGIEPEADGVTFKF